jgi:N6-adenosine-specific RNA methylase IME4
VTGPYRCIVADPAWHWQSRSSKGEGRSAKRHYSTMSFDELAGMRPLIDRWTADDCALFLWSLNSVRQPALDLIAAWGFEFNTVAFTWAKQNPSGSGWHFGLGYWTRQNTEQCLLATRGRPLRLARDVPELLIAPRREHSRKPDEAYRRVERLVGGPYLELFAREKRPGWDCWGNETDKFDEAA